MNSLIKRKSTGPPEKFAQRLGIKRSTLHNNLHELKELGADIKYSYMRQTYYYADDKEIKVSLSLMNKSLPEMAEVDGGFSFPKNAIEGYYNSCILSHLPHSFVNLPL